MPYIFLGIFFLTLSMAQHPDQPFKMDDSEFRGDSIIFKIDDKNEEQEISLSKNFDGNYSLKNVVDSELDGLKKISSKKATKLEKDFSSYFIEVSQDLGEKKNNCKIIYVLQFKKQMLNVCENENEKIKWVKSNLNSLNDLFKN